jgi:hypothetical protein
LGKSCSPVLEVLPDKRTHTTGLVWLVPWRDGSRRICFWQYFF